MVVQPVVAGVGEEEVGVWVIVGETVATTVGVTVGETVPFKKDWYHI
jgi:hypothetical protein